MQEGAHVDVAAPVGGKLRVGFHAGVDGRFAPFARLEDPAFPLDSVYAALFVVSGGASDQDGAIEFDQLNQDAVATPT